MSKYRIVLNGKVYEMEIELINEEDEKHKGPFVSSGSPYDFKSADSVVRVIIPQADQQTHFNENIICSPMPGMISKVMMKSGDLVKADEPIIVLEAMKMENEIAAPRDGTIKEILVKEGQVVPGNYPLFEIESEE